MKLFAPKNNWDMKSPESWWPLVGSIQTSAGIAITEDSALALTAFSCGIRVISETMASLPCNLLEQVSNNTTQKATSHPLYRIVHDQPNPEQDSMVFFDSQIALQVGWGNCYAEIERFAGEIVALWPIHPSRIPLRNITRNSYSPGEIVVGEPGEIVYWVNSDDGTSTPIPASSMLHVAGVLSRNGITGRSIVHLGKNALGIAQATEDHAGAFFKNGASPNIAIKSPKTVGEETAKRLRQQWQEIFGGVKNHYKTLLLEDGMEAVPFTLSPEASQLIMSRQFSVNEISRLLRVPPHMLSDLSRATFSNIEEMGQEFVVYSLMPWIVRWEKALFRQLLTPEEQKKYRFKWNVMGLLRGNQAARSAFYQVLFNMGALSPNDIRELEDLNPVDGGDQRFVPANNLVPLTTIGELAQANVDKVKADVAAATQQMQANDSSNDSEDTQPTAEPSGAGQQTDIQTTAMNGAQIQALVQIATMLATGQLPPDGTKAMIRAAFPLMQESLIEVMVRELAAFEPPQPEPQPAPPPPEPAPAPAEPPPVDQNAEQQAAIAQSLAEFAESLDSLRESLSEMRQEIAQQDRARDERIDKQHDSIQEIAGKAEELETRLNSLVETDLKSLVEAVQTHGEAQNDRIAELASGLDAKFAAILEEARSIAVSASERMTERDEKFVEAMASATTAIKDVGESVTQVVAAAQEASRAEREQLPEIIAKAVEPLAQSVTSAVESAKEIPERTGSAVSEAVKPLADAIPGLIEAQNAVSEEIPKRFDALAEKIDAIEIPEPPPPDTSIAEAVRVREVEVERRERELSEQLASEREASRGVLTSAIKVRLESLAEWESKALAKAVDRPKEFIQWRERFYPRFVKHFVASMSDLEPFAEKIGVKLDLSAAAERYALGSIRDLKGLDEFAADNWHDRLKEGVDKLRKDLWLGRPADFSGDMVQRGLAGGEQ